MDGSGNARSNKELLILIGKSFLQVVKTLWHKLYPSRVTVTHWLLNLSFILLNAATMVGMAYLVVKTDPDLLSRFSSFGVVTTETQTNSSSFWGILGAIGSILAGTGTVGLLWFGWKTSLKWREQVQFDKHASIKLKVSESCLYEARTVYDQVMNNILPEFKGNSEATRSSSTKEFTYKISMLRATVEIIDSLEWNDAEAMKVKTKALLKSIDDIVYKVNNYSSLKDPQSEMQNSSGEVVTASYTVLQAALNELKLTK